MSTLFVILGTLILLNVALLLFSVNRIDKKQVKRPVRNNWVAPDRQEIRENTKAA